MTKRTKMTKIKAIRNFIRQNPSASMKEICAATKASYSYVSALKSKMQGDDWVTTLIASTAKPLQPVLDTVSGTTPEENAALAYQAGQGRTRTSAPEPLEGIDRTLAERGDKYGKFVHHATVTQKLKRVLHEHANEHGKSFALDQAEALDMICHKIGRIVNGDPDYADSWIDIAGYAKLVADRLETGKEV